MQKLKFKSNYATTAAQTPNDITNTRQRLAYLSTVETRRPSLFTSVDLKCWRLDRKSHCCRFRLPYVSWWAQILSGNVSFIRHHLRRTSRLPALGLSFWINVWTTILPRGTTSSWRPRWAQRSFTSYRTQLFLNVTAWWYRCLLFTG